VILSSLFQTKRANQTTAANPSAYFLDMLGGQPSTAGVAVSEESAQSLTAVDGCINILSKTLAQVPLRLYRETDKGPEKAENHRLYPITSSVSNKEMSAFILKERMQYHLTTWGNSYALKFKNRRGQVTELMPLLPDRTWPERFTEGSSRILTYVTTIDDTQVRLPVDDVLHIPGFGFDGLVGRSPIHAHREAIGYSLATQQYSSRFYKNGAQLRGVLSFEGEITDVEKLRKQWQETYGGNDNQFKTAVLESGMKYENVGIPPEDAQFIETRKLQRSDIATIFQVPLHFLGEANTKYNNRELEALDFVIYSMGSWFVRWEQEFDRQLLTSRERENGLFFKFDPRALLRGDNKARAELYAKMIEWGVYTRNEVRLWEDLQTLPGLDEPLTPMNMGDGTEDEQEPGDEDEDKDPDDERTEANRLRAIAMGAEARVKRREAGQLRKLYDASDDDAMFIRSAEVFYAEKHWDLLTDALVMTPAAAHDYCKKHLDCLAAADDLNSLLTEWENGNGSP